MKFVLLFTLLVASGCSHETKQTAAAQRTDATRQPETTNKVDNTTHHTTKDTIRIVTGTGDLVKYSKTEFNGIVDEHPELTTDRIEDPDLTYYCHGKKGFNSEAGQDGYYVLYAYFLKQKNGIAACAERRRKLIELYLHINSLFQRFQHGGTYFGHQSWRIDGYAEYGVYLYEQKEGRGEKTYDIAKAKELYIKSLRQLVDDELSIDGIAQGEEKIKRRRELNQTVDEIEKAITGVFYLRRAQAFHHGYYGYW